MVAWMTDGTVRKRCILIRRIMGPPGRCTQNEELSGRGRLCLLDDDTVRLSWVVVPRMMEPSSCGG